MLYFIYVYIYIHTHTLNIYIYIYIYTYMPGTVPTLVLLVVWESWLFYSRPTFLGRAKLAPRLVSALGWISRPECPVFGLGPRPNVPNPCDSARFSHNDPNFASGSEFPKPPKTIQQQGQSECRLKAVEPLL